jgi:two-component system response regulator YesN
MDKRRHNEDVPSSINQIVWNTIFSMDELAEYFARLFSEVSAALKNETVYTNDDPMERMKLYVQRNFKRNLSLEMLADLFYMNPSYLSHIFKDRTGQKLVDYINQVRIDKAKELLENTPAKMSQIAKNVGYSNDKYFFRVFKGAEGCTPEQYRNRIRSSMKN